MVWRGRHLPNPSSPPECNGSRTLTVMLSSSRDRTSRVQHRASTTRTQGQRPKSRPRPSWRAVITAIASYHERLPKWPGVRRPTSRHPAYSLLKPCADSPINFLGHCRAVFTMTSVREILIDEISPGRLWLTQRSRAQFTYADHGFGE